MVDRRQLGNEPGKFLSYRLDALPEIADYQWI